MRTAPAYSKEYLQVFKPQPLIDKHLETLASNVLNGTFKSNYIEYDEFINKCSKWFESTTLNNLKGLNIFSRKDIIIGCTQFIDNIYMQGSLQTIIGDYKYHERLGLSHISNIGSLKPKIPLIIALPFPSTGDVHLRMKEILNECLEKDIPVHIDGAWITCCRNIVFDFNHPAIKSVGISLSKGLGLGWNRVGIRYTTETTDSISIMNDFNMNNRALITVANYFIESTSPDHLWNMHKNKYQKVCRDFNLTETNSVYLALDNNQPVGISPLIRLLEEQDS